jgi:hypothetical protein
MWSCLSLAGACPYMAGPGDMKTIVDDITMPAQQCVKPPENVVFKPVGTIDARSRPQWCFHSIFWMSGHL